MIVQSEEEWRITTIFIRKKNIGRSIIEFLASNKSSFIIQVEKF